MAVGSRFQQPSARGAWAWIPLRADAYHERPGLITPSQLRADLGLTQTEMGRLLGMSGSDYSRIERGARRPTQQQRAALRLILWISMIHDLHGTPGVREYLAAL